jgi:hypothetical protein
MVAAHTAPHPARHALLGFLMNAVAVSRDGPVMRLIDNTGDMRFLDNVSAGGSGFCYFAPNICSSLPATRLVQKMTGVAVMAVTERLRGN